MSEFPAIPPLAAFPGIPPMSDSNKQSFSLHLRMRCSLVTWKVNYPVSSWACNMHIIKSNLVFQPNHAICTIVFS